MDHSYQAPKIQICDLYNSCPDGIEEMLNAKLSSLNDEIARFENIRDRFKTWLKYEDEAGGVSGQIKWEFYKLSHSDNWYKNEFQIFKIKKISEQEYKEWCNPNVVLYCDDSGYYVGFDQLVRADEFFIWLYGKDASEEQWKTFCEEHGLNDFNVNQDWKEKYAERRRIEYAITQVKITKGEKLPSSKESFQEKVDLAKQVNITQVIQYFNIQARRNMCKCPFHDERTASLSISPTKNIFKCFGCGKAGDPIKFVEYYNNCDFKSAVEFLCDIY